jgi:UDP-N-acetylmuramoyl-L-alanyl-D-glutamate--2,6-diaminopimelate ligase
MSAVDLGRLLPDVAAAHGVAVSGLSQDSRMLHPGDAFVALAGFGHHGLAFAAQARERGAAAILFEPPAPADLAVPADAIAVPGLRARLGALADAFHGQPSQAMTVVGVTGTNGKTSTVQLLAQAWHRLGLRSATLGTLGVGLYGQLEPTGFTTPQVSQVHAMLAGLRARGAQAVAMEVSSHALDQGRVDGVHFDVAVFTNLTRDHLDYHHTMQAYGAAKARLFAMPGLKAAVVNLDDAFGRELAAGLRERLPVVGVSAAGAAGADVAASALALDNRGIAFELSIAGQRQRVRSPLLGHFNVDNLLAVAGVLHALAVPAAQIAALLPQLQPIRGRMNRLGGEDGLPLVVVDYAHTPDALAQALQGLRAHAAGRLLCVFGCGGERDAGKRPQMAAIAERLADCVIVTDDNPRHEDGDAIVADIVAGFAAHGCASGAVAGREGAPRHAAVAVQRDRAAAIAQAIGQAGAEDIVLIAGKGHEPYQDVAGTRHPFDDTAVATAALQARAGAGAEVAR